MTLHPDYLPTLLKYYEEEIAGAAFFEALAERLPDPGRKRGMTMLADVERHCAAIVRPLIARHGLTPRDDETLIAMGRADADRLPSDWTGMAAAMRESFPGFVDDFRRLETLGPARDRTILARMTAHEAAAVEFLERDAAGDADAAEPLARYLATPVATAEAA